MLTEPLDSVRRRARRLLGRLPADLRRGLGAAVVEDRAQVGGGALPTVELPTAALALGTTSETARTLEAALRRGEPPVIGRIADGHLLLDCRTVLPSQVPSLAAALVAAAGSPQ
jgi:L-seryl-tRNA(Ser) seleniumtransferase